MVHVALVHVPYLRIDDEQSAESNARVGDQDTIPGPRVAREGGGVNELRVQQSGSRACEPAHLFLK